MAADQECEQPSVFVVTVVHHPEDARIRHRQISALLHAGWRVTYAAPFTDYGLPVPPPQTAPAATAPAQRTPNDGLPASGELRCLDVPRATGRRRLRALTRARQVLNTLGPRHDVVLLHDPELLLAACRTPGTVVAWDVHEDTAAAVEAKEWIPGPLRRSAALAVRAAERAAERRVALLLAEHRYQDRFDVQHPVVPNTVAVPPAVPPPGDDRVVYLGTLTVERGAHEVVEVARLLHQETAGAVRVEVMGPAHGPAGALLTEAADAGLLQWHGFVASATALAALPGALAGLSLLRDMPNYRHSMPTKVVEYMAHGVPVVTTPLPIAAELVTTEGAGVVVPFGDAPAAVRAILALRRDPARATALGAAGHRAARRTYDWAAQSAHFVAVMDRLAAQRSR